jgi:hypothetical protein
MSWCVICCAVPVAVLWVEARHAASLARVRASNENSFAQHRNNNNKLYCNPRGGDDDDHVMMITQQHNNQQTKHNKTNTTNKTHTQHQKNKDPRAAVGARHAAAGRDGRLPAL